MHGAPGGRSWGRIARWPAPAVVAGAVVAGAAWGGLARAWMRLISRDPEFPLSGTLFIVGGFAVAATAQAIALVSSRHPSRAFGRVGRVVGIVGMLPLFVGAGAMLLPTVLGGGLALGRRSWTRPARALAAVVAAAPVVAISARLVDDLGLGPRVVAGVVGLLVVYGGIVVAVTASLGGRVEARPLPRALRLLAAVGGVGLLLLVAVVMVGVPV
jgi:hypothetical protein